VPAPFLRGAERPRRRTVVDVMALFLGVAALRLALSWPRTCHYAWSDDQFGDTRFW